MFGRMFIVILTLIKHKPLWISCCVVFHVLGPALSKVFKKWDCHDNNFTIEIQKTEYSEKIDLVFCISIEIF